jgi:LmbE family N-acetylglucosaminyl deacetylase
VLQLPLSALGNELRRILVLGCHPDDIEIGCGGTILTLTRARRDLDVTWVVLAAAGERADEARASAAAFLTSARSADVQLHDCRDGFLPHAGAPLKEIFEGLKRVRPDLILTHARTDLHQDHRFASELTWQTFRDHLILEYEIPKYDGDLGAPNVFVPLTDDVVDEKLALLRSHHVSQTTKHWFDEELFRGVLRLRGVEAATRYTEAFTVRKLSLLAG